MKSIKTIYSNKEWMLLVFVLIYLVLKKFPMPIIIMGTISLGLCLYALKYFTNRLRLQNQSFLKADREKQESYERNKAARKSGEIDESGFKEEIRIFKKVIEYAESCNQYYKYVGLEAENFIDERCKSFVDLVAPLLAVNPNKYQLVIQIRPSLEPYVIKKVKEYSENIPALSDLEAEFRKVHNKTSFTQNNAESDFDMNSAMLAIYVTNKYGFSKEVLYVAKNMSTELYNMIIRIYDQRLISIGSYYDLAYECYKDPENASKLR